VGCRSNVADVEIREALDEDLEAVYEIVAENRIRLFGDVEGFFLEHMQNLWRRLRGNWVAVSGSEILGAAAIVMHAVEVDVRSEARRRGIGTRLLRVAEESTDLEVLRADAVTLEPAGASFLRANGYEKAFEYWLMGIEVATQPGEPVWPDGVVVRTFRAEDAWPLWNLLELAYAEEEDPYPPFDEWETSLLGDPSFEAENWFLVEAESELVAAALNWSDAYVKDIVVHPEWRRRGLGGALMRQTFRHFEARGHPRVSLKTDSINPTEAWRLYERLGMRKERTYEVFHKRL
jgi:ribosomal protein S18 acetylase RimI-like enzyme